MDNYKKKLKEWNDTDKYRKELDFLYGLINPTQGNLILDFGCGIMTAIENFNTKNEAYFYGYDVEEYGEKENYHLYDKEIKRKYECIYLMHSLAHIKGPINCLTGLKSNLSAGGKIVIITPNWQWMDKGYNNDPTVVKHYDMETLSKLVTDAGYNIEQLGQFGEMRKDIHQHNRLSNERLFLIARPK